MRKKGKFSILESEANKEIDFWSEMISVINNTKLSIAFIITDKVKAKLIGWNSIKILKESYVKILEQFAVKHLAGHKGKIILESAFDQDQYVIYAHNRLQNMGIPSERITGYEYRNKVTSLSIVTKLNNDTEVQLADSLAIMADLVYEMKIKKIKKPTKVQAMMIRLVERKMKDIENSGIFEILV